MTATTTIRPMPADENGRGNLAGFEARCPICGLVMRSTMRTSIEADARQHAAWHAATDLRTLLVESGQ